MKDNFLDCDERDLPCDVGIKYGFVGVSIESVHCVDETVCPDFSESLKDGAACTCPKTTVFEAKIKYITDSIADMLVEKNKKYGNSALEPKRIFSKADSAEQLKVRIDDKLSRISNQNINEDEDVIMDLLGYLVLLKVVIDDSK